MHQTQDAARAARGRLPLCQEIKCAIHCYMTRISYTVTFQMIYLSQQSSML